MKLTGVFASALSLNVLSVAAQAGSLLVATQLLAVEEFGSFLAISATSSIAFTLVGLGTADFMTTEVARNPNNASSHLRAALEWTFATAFVFLFIVSYLETAITGQEFLTIVLLNLNYLLFGRLISISENFAVAIGYSHAAAGTRLLYALLQLCAFFSLTVVSNTDRFHFLGLAMAIAGLLAATISLAANVWPRLDLSLERSSSNWQVSIQLMVGQTLAASTANLDRVIAAAILDAQTAAMYSLASRAVQIAGTPLSIYFRTIYHKYFLLSEEGDVQRERAFFRNSAALAAAIASISAIASSAGFYVVTETVLQEYRPSAPAFYVLSVTMPLTAIYMSYGNKLHAERRFARRNTMDGIATALVIISMLTPTKIRPDILTSAISVVLARLLSTAIMARN